MDKLMTALNARAVARDAVRAATMEELDLCHEVANDLGMHEAQAVRHAQILRRMGWKFPQGWAD